MNAHYKLNLYESYGIMFNLYIYNLLDQKNEVAVDNQTGRAYTSIIEESELLSHRSNFNTYYDRVRNPSMFSAPRMVKLVMSVNF